MIENKIVVGEVCLSLYDVMNPNLISTLALLNAPFKMGLHVVFRPAEAQRVKGQCKTLSDKLSDKVDLFQVFVHKITDGKYFESRYCLKEKIGCGMTPNLQSAVLVRINSSQSSVPMVYNRYAQPFFVAPIAAYHYFF